MSTPKIKFFIDAEFIEDGKTIDLISLGVVCENGDEFYAISNEFDPNKASDWVKENVIAKLESPMTHGHLWMSRAGIAKKFLEFIDKCTGVGAKPEFWGYYADYDWVVLCQLFGTMMQLPKGWPMYCRDIKQLCDFLGNPELPKQAEGEHNALADAKWNWEAYRWLEGKVVGNEVVLGHLRKERDEAIREREACHKCWDDFAAKVGTVIDDFHQMPLFQGADKIVEEIVSLRERVELQSAIKQEVEGSRNAYNSICNQILDDVLVLLSEHKYPTPEKTYKEDGGWSLAYADLKKCMENMLDERDDSRRTANLLGVRFSDLQACYKNATGKDCDYPPVADVERKAITLQHQLNQSNKRLAELEQTRPYDCYWSRRALAAEKALQGSDTLIKSAQSILTDTLVPDGYNEQEAVEKLVALLDGPQQREVQAATKKALQTQAKEKRDICATEGVGMEEQLIKDFAAVVNKHSLENNSDTPDFVLGRYLVHCLHAFDHGVLRREHWYGRPSPTKVFAKPSPITEAPAVPLQQGNQPSAAPTPQS